MKKLFLFVVAALAVITVSARTVVNDEHHHDSSPVENAESILVKGVMAQRLIH